MNRDFNSSLTRIIRNLSVNLLSANFEKDMLFELSELFQPSHIVFARRRKTEKDEICICEMLNGHYTALTISHKEFVAKYGLSIPDTITDNPPFQESFSADNATIVFPLIIDSYNCIISMSEIRNTAFVNTNHLRIVNLAIELTFRTWHSIKDKISVVTMDSATCHKIKTIISSISTSIEMLMLSELTEDDRHQLNRLAHKGADELIEALTSLQRASCVEDEGY